MCHLNIENYFLLIILLDGCNIYMHDRSQRQFRKDLGELIIFFRNLVRHNLFIKISAGLLVYFNKKNIDIDSLPLT